jgi:mono/diheme cytochrome c family protein
MSLSKPKLVLSNHKNFSPVASLLLALFSCLILVASLSACTNSKVTLPTSDDGLVSTKVTLGDREPIWPNDDPSIPDGKGVYVAQNCASCHGADGKPVAGKATVDFSSKEWGRKQKPVDQYDFITFGKESETTQGGSEHLTVRSTLRPPQIWNMIFYLRSLSTPPLTDAEISDVLPVFGGNCAVCHGTKGYGNGPLMKGNVLEPAPANFQSFPRFYDRTDEVLWDHIAHGIQWEGMPNFLGKTDKPKKITFDEPYIWKLVGFVRHFHESNKTEDAARAQHAQEDKEEKEKEEQAKKDKQSNATKPQG